jgi:hypothetical protein
MASVLLLIVHAKEGACGGLTRWMRGSVKGDEGHRGYLPTSLAVELDQCCHEKHATKFGFLCSGRRLGAF